MFSAFLKGQEELGEQPLKGNIDPWGLGFKEGLGMFDFLGDIHWFVCHLSLWGGCEETLGHRRPQNYAVAVSRWCLSRIPRKKQKAVWCQGYFMSVKMAFGIWNFCWVWIQLSSHGVWISLGIFFRYQLLNIMNNEKIYRWWEICFLHIWIVCRW